MQTLDFPCMKEETTAVNVKLEPGDGTVYSFVISRTRAQHDWGKEEGPIIGVASVSGCMFGGQWMPLRRVREWWAETKNMTPDKSLGHNFIGWVIREMRPGTTTNPWTVRAGLLAVLKVFGVEEDAFPEEHDGEAKAARAEAYKEEG
ncbi:MAG: hypothetical protein IMZ71_02610 [Chloroflexi bacterium]|nr:hypothetical protein [Chloroflexota bacterium]